VNRGRKKTTMLGLVAVIGFASPAFAQPQSSTMSETSVLTPICPPDGTVKKYAAITETSHGSRVDNADVCKYDVNSSNEEKLLGVMDVPGRDIQQAGDMISGIISGKPYANAITFRVWYSSGEVFDETITRIPGKAFTMADGTTYMTRGIMRHAHGLYNGRTYEQNAYFPIVGKFVLMTALEKAVTINPGNWWPIKATGFSPASKD
jgi:hypothetical protein